MTSPRATAAAARGRRAGERAGRAALDHSGHAAVLVAGEETGGRFALVELVLARGAEPPCHRHHWEDETLYVLAGALRVRVGDAWVEAPAGAAVFLPRGGEHGLVVTTREARVLAALTPAGFEGFYREVAGAAPGLERLVALAARYGCEITGPPPTSPAPGGRAPPQGSRGDRRRPWRTTTTQGAKRHPARLPTGTGSRALRAPCPGEMELG